MTTSDPDADARQPALTAAERARLRPTVDVAAFERFLAELPDMVRPGVQRAAVLHFAREVTAADVCAFIASLGQVQDVVPTEPVSPAASEVRPAQPPDALTFTPIPTTQQLFSMEPPDSPRLRPLWDAIEPQQLGSG